MSLDPQLRAQLAETIYVASPGSVDTYGQITYSAPTAVKARVEYRPKIGSKPGEGEEGESDTFVITESAISIVDRIWLPGDSQSDPTLARRPMSVLRLPDERGAVDHYETRV